MTTKLKTRTFIDMDAEFNMNPVTEDAARIFDDNAIKRSLRSLIFAEHYDHPFHPEIFSPIPNLLFQNFTPDLGNIIQRLLAELINNYEPRVRLISIDVTTVEDEHSLNASITYTTINNPNPITYNVLLQRLR